MSSSGQIDQKNNNENNVGNDGMASEAANKISHKENINSELTGANSKSNNNDPFDFEEFLKFDNIGDILSVSIE